MKKHILLLLIVLSGVMSFSFYSLYKADLVFAGGGALRCGVGCVCTGFGGPYTSCRGPEYCTTIGDGISGTAFYSGGCGAGTGTYSHDYTCPGRSCSGPGGGGGGGGCPKGTVSKTLGPECRKDYGGGWKEAEGCGDCGVVKVGSEKGQPKVCAKKTICEAKPSSTPVPSPTVAPFPTPSPGLVSINKFEITNFRLQEALNGEQYYLVLKNQMDINQPNFQINLAWAVANANACQASCKYVKIDDYLQNPDFDNLPAQSWPCANNIENQTTFSGDVELPVGQAKTKPKENGMIRYTLSCQGDLGNDKKDLLVTVQSLQWFETIPILNLKLSDRLLASVVNLFDNFAKSFSRTGFQ